MSVIIVPRKHLRQPQGRVVVSPEPRLSTMLIGGREVISGATLARQNGGGVGTYPQGVGLQFAKASQQYVSGFPANAAWGQYSVVAQVLGTATDTNYSNVFTFAYNSAFGQIQLRHTATDWDFYHQAAPTGNWKLAQGAGKYKNGVVQTLVVTFDGAQISLYIDGFHVASTAAAGYGLGEPNIAFLGCDYNSGPVSGSYFDGTIGLLGLSNGVAWSRDYAQRVSADPWGVLLQADPLRIYSLPSGPISWSSLTASNITQTGATLTLGGITR